MNLEADLLQRRSNIVRIVAGIAQRTCIGIVRIADDQRHTPLGVRRIRGGDYGPPNSDQNRQAAQHCSLRQRVRSRGKDHLGTALLDD